MSWDFGILDTIKDSATELIGEYAERELERYRPEPDNTANLPPQNPVAPVMKYDDVAAARMAQIQAEKAAAATPDPDFFTKNKTMVMIGGGVFLAFGLLIVAKGGR